MSSGGVDRIPPQSLEAEMAVLGAILVEPDLLDVVAEHVAPADFYAHVHETIFAAMRKQAEAKAPMDKIALAEALKRQNQLENVGGISYLTSLMDTVQTAATAEYYAKIIAEKSGLRALIHIGQETAARGYHDEDLGPVEVANMMTAKMEAAVLLRRVRSTGLSGSALASEMERDWLASRARRLHTPWGPINAGPKGFGVRELTIWAGHPGQGKSTALINLADFLARRYGREMGPVAFFPPEMGRIKSNYRFLSMYTGIDSKDIEERVNLSPDEAGRVRGAIRMLSELPIVVFDKKPVLDIPTLRLQLRKLKRERGLSAAIIDHVGWFKEVREAGARGGASAVHSAQEQIFISAAEIADELEIAMHLVMHIKRPKDMPSDGGFPKPTMLDLRGGGNPEGHAHNIVMVWRPDVKSDPTNGALIVEKARSGGEGTYFLHYDGRYSVWTDPHDTLNNGVWFPRAQAEAEVPRVALPYKDAPEEEEPTEFYEDDEFPTERDYAEEEEGGLD